MLSTLFGNIFIKETYLNRKLIITRSFKIMKICSCLDNQLEPIIEYIFFKKEEKLHIGKKLYICETKE